MLLCGIIAERHRYGLRVLEVGVDEAGIYIDQVLSSDTESISSTLILGSPPLGTSAVSSREFVMTIPRKFGSVKHLIRYRGDC